MTARWRDRGATKSPPAAHPGAGDGPRAAAGQPNPPELLRIEDLRVTYPGGVEALEGIDLTLGARDSLAVVGESAAGKSTLARALVGLLPGARVQGRMHFDGIALDELSEESFRALRWTRIAYAPQGAAFNPVTPLRTQIAEPLRTHLGMDKTAANARASELAADVGLDPALLDRFRHELSGGQQRLALLAMALTCGPDLLILDEPTSGLDPLTVQGLLATIRRARAEREFALIVISHDLPTVSQLCSRMLVMYAGRPAELGDTVRVVTDAAHPYTWGLINAHPVMNTSKDLRPIRGTAASPTARPSGCPFHPRCPQAEDICRSELPALERHRGREIACLLGGMQPLLRIEQLTKSYEIGAGMHRQLAPAVRGVSLDVLHGEVVGLIGPSGSGKSTVARMAAGLLPPDGGHVLLALGGLGRQKPGEGDYRGQDLWALPERALRAARRTIAIIFQNPGEAMNPRLGVLELVREPLDIAGDLDPAERDRRCSAELERVGLDPHHDLLAARPHELSGGEQQRVAIARALVGDPRLLLADEATSMLDASEQARIVTLLKDLQVERGLSMLFISHDIALVRKVVDRIVVLDDGVIAEEGLSGAVSSAPAHATTRRLVQAAPAYAASARSTAAQAKEVAP